MRTRTARRSTCLLSVRRGIVLLAVLVVVVLLTLAAYQYAELMTAEYQAVDSYRRSAQARAFAESGIHYTAALLASQPVNTQDNAQAFGARLVQPGDHPRFQGRFSIVAAAGPDEGAGFRYGVIDEGGKLNLNALLTLDSSGQIAHDMLLKLPNMTEEVVNAILDWIDPDDTPRANGAENSFYSTQDPAYRCKNGPLDSLDELLLVRGVTPQLLWGNDWDRNGTADPGQDNGAGSYDPGLSAYVTVYGRELNLDSTGQPRIYVNDTDMNGLLEKLTTALGPDLANYIAAYRQYGPASSSSSGGRSSGGSGRGGPPLARGSINLQRGRPRSLASLVELIDSSVSIPSERPGGQPTVYPSPLNDKGAQRQLLPRLLDTVTTVKDAELPGRININTAPRAVLAALPSLTGTDVSTILARRPSATTLAESDDLTYRTPAWLLTEANLPPATLRALEKYVTGRSQVYRVQAVGHFERGGPTARLEAVFDTNNGRPRFLYWRDLTELGKGFELGQRN